MDYEDNSKLISAHANLLDSILKVPQSSVSVKNLNENYELGREGKASMENDNLAFNENPKSSNGVKNTNRITEDSVDPQRFSRQSFSLRPFESLGRNFGFQIPSSTFSKTACLPGCTIKLTTMWMFISVLDRNDNSPQFQGSPYRFSVAETETVGQTVFTEVKVTDADEGRNSEIQLSCLAAQSSPDACETFQISPSRLGPGEYLGLIVLKKPLNYEEKSSYNLVVEARDGGEQNVLRATTDIIIEVEDIQDQSPVFLNGPYSSTVAEGTPPGQTIFEIKVRDGDTGIPRDLQLDIIGDSLDYFSLENERVSPEGIVTVNLGTTENIIDREHPDILKEGGLYPFQVKIMTNLTFKLHGLNISKLSI